MKRLVVAVIMLAPLVAFLPPQASDAAACRPALGALTLSHSSVPGGAQLTGAITLTCAGNAVSTVRLRGFKGITLPPTVRVARRASRVTFTIGTAVGHAARRGTVEATLGRVHRRAVLAVTRTPRTCRTPSLTTLAMPRLVYVGDRPVATVRLTCAPTRPVRISLASNDALLPVPKTITAGAYYNSANMVLAPTADEAGTYQARLTAGLGRTSKSATITVDPGLAFVQIPAASSAPDSVDFNIIFTGVVPAGGLTVRLAASNPAVTLPASYTFTQQGSLGGGISGITVQTVTKNTPVTLSATLGSVTRRATITLLPPFDSSDTAALSAENGPGNIYGQESGLEYILTLSNPAPATGLTATFSSPSLSVVVESPASFITGGFTDGFVDIDTANVTSAVHTEIDATVDGVKVSLPLTIEPGLSSVTVPASVTGGHGFMGTVSLAGPVDTATTVSLQALDGVVSPPGQVVIPAGQSSATFTATTGSVTSDTPVQIEATLGTTNVFSDPITVTP